MYTFAMCVFCGWGWKDESSLKSVWDKHLWDTKWRCSPEDNGAYIFGSKERGSKLEVQILAIKTEIALEVFASQWKNLRKGQRA